MTNEEAFRKWRTDYESDYDKKPSYLEVWQAAISYMQEKSEPVATIHRGIAYWIGKEPPEGSNLYTTPQRQQLMKRLTDEQINKCFEKVMFDEEAEPTRERIANAIMDAMQELNK